MSGEQPGLLGLVLRFESLDLVGVLQREADFVEAVEQAVLAVRRDVEGEGFTRGRGDLLRFEVDGEPVAFVRFAFLEELVHRGGGQDDGQQAGDSITLKVGESRLVMKADGTIVLSGKDITIEGSTHIQLDSKRIDLN